MNFIGLSTAYRGDTTWRGIAGMLGETAVLLDALRGLAIGILVGACVLVLRRQAGQLARYLSVTVLLLTLWATLTVLPGVFGIPSADEQAIGTALSLVQFVAGAGTAVFFFAYVRQYTGRDLTRRGLVALGLPVVVVAGLLLLREAVEESLPAVVTTGIAVAGGAMYVYAIILFLISPYLLFRVARRYRQVTYTQVVAVGIGIIGPYLARAISGLSRPTEGGETVRYLPVEITFVGCLIGGVALMYALRQHPILTAFPESGQVARDEVIEDLQEGVFILNEEDHIIDLNPAATQLCGRPTKTLIGQPITTAVEGLSELPEEGLTRITLQTPEGPRQFEVTVSTIQNDTSGQIGKTVLLRDITDKKTREQQLEVLTRVLRHNLRNELDSVLAYTNEIEDPALRETIRSRLTTLAEMGAKARDIEDVLAVDHEARSEFDLGTRVQSVTNQLQEQYPDSVISLNVSEPVYITAQPALVDRLVTELLENAIEHNENATPRVEVTVMRSERPDRTVAITIADDGPGIPEHERRIIQTETETPLDHGTGIGLWVVNWIVNALGGELAFETDGTTGSTVTVRL